MTPATHTVLQLNALLRRNKLKYHKDIERVLFCSKEIKKKTKVLAERLSKDYDGKFPVFICVLKGAVLFFSDIIQQITIDIEIDFITVKSYEDKTESSGQLSIIQDVTTNLRGRDVLIVDDIIDSGNTIAKLKELFEKKGASSVKVACLLDKPERRNVVSKIDYTCFHVENEFVIGYGLDYKQKYRNINCIGVIKEEVVSK